MSVQELPKPNTQALSWFYGEYKKNTLVLDPKYQRNPIWSLGQKCFLIDSLISQSPIPQVFINITIKGSARDRETVYEVVDGQQRLRTILEFMNDDWALIALTAKSYPVSDIYKPHIGKKYSQLPGHLQDAIWNFPLAVQELRGWDEFQIRSLFRRLNYVVERLNKQEMRHSQFFGEFVNAVETLADSEFWDDVYLFSRRESQRMKDIEFISELFVIILDGVQDGQSTLDKFYADYDVVFQKKNAKVAKFNQVLNSLRTIRERIKVGRFSKKADFYGLFAAAAKLNETSIKPLMLVASSKRLRELERELEKDIEQMSDLAQRYYSTVIEGPNKLAKRQERTSILIDVLSSGN